MSITEVMDNQKTTRDSSIEIAGITACLIVIEEW